MLLEPKATGLEPSQAHAMFEQLRQSVVDNPLQLPGCTVQLAVSTGLVTQISDNLEDLIRLSDDRLYTAKETGRNRVISQNMV
ncbi:MAG: diguanylate cyclase, partial [Phycisphaerales bacterium]|nr:diguanylate cyclase [Phycisphaerales bacterium]